MGFPGGLGGKNPPANAGDRSLMHATGQLSPHATTTEPVLRNKRSHRNEKATPPLEGSPCSLQLRKKPECINEDPVQQKINKP